MTSLTRLLMLSGIAALAACGGSTTEPASANPQSAQPVATQPSAWTTLGTRASASQPAQSIAPRAVTPSWQDYNPPAQFPGRVAENNHQIAVDDGVIIALNVVRPLDAAGLEAGARPTIVTFTPYNKDVSNFASLGGGINAHFVSHGYNHVLVDVRGTGRSGGAWDPFSAREQQDYAQVLDWVTQQPWSNGDLGLWGISATATTAVLAASHGHPAVKAVFPIVPHGDIYRDVVFVGGQVSAAFLPAWMAAVTALGVANPSFYLHPEQYLTAVGQHILGANEFIIPRTIGVLSGDEQSAYDNAYWANKAPLEVSRGLQVPTFIVGGLYDIFQRSEPLNYEALKHHTTAKLLIGPWHHLQASAGEGLPLNGVPKLDHIALQWFDQYLRDIDNGAPELPNVTQWVWGQENWAISSDWPHPQASAGRFFLRSGGGLERAAPSGSEAPSQTLQQPFNGVCSESALQISLGLLGYAPLPCWYDDRLAQSLEVVFETPALEEDMYFNGPLQADIWMSTTAMNAGLVVRVSDLEPGGRARALTSGIHTASLRAVDESRSRYLDGEMIQPWHPYTAEAQQAVGSGNIVKVPVEIFPTSALIKKGHRLRISVGASNFPFALMPLPGLLQSAAGVLSVYHDAEHPSSIVLPLVPAAVLADPN